MDATTFCYAKSISLIRKSMDLKYWKAYVSQVELRLTPLLSLGLSSHLIIVASLIATLLSLYVIYCRFWSPLARIPGPFAASLSRLWLVQQSRAGNMHRTMIELHRKHGQVVRTGPNEVSVTDPAVIKRIYGAFPTPIHCASQSRLLIEV